MLVASGFERQSPNWRIDASRLCLRVPQRFARSLDLTSPFRAPRSSRRAGSARMALSGSNMFETTVAGSLPKPLWLAETEKLWPAWRLEGAALAAGKIDATILAVKRQEDAGIDIVSDGEQARIHFVHGFLANLDGIDFQRRQVIGIRADRYKAEAPTVTGPIRRKGSVHGAEARIARAHTRGKLKY